MQKLIALFFFVFALPVFSQTSPEATTLKDPADLFAKIWSPYCKGVSLLECPSSQAEDLRKQIRARMGTGESGEAILQEMNQKFGSTLRMEPDQGGRESLAYWIPWISVFIAGIFVGIFWKLKSKKPKALATPAKAKNTIQESHILKDLESRL